MSYPTPTNVNRSLRNLLSPMGVGVSKVVTHRHLHGVWTLGAHDVIYYGLADQVAVLGHKQDAVALDTWSRGGGWWWLWRW